MKSNLELIRDLSLALSLHVSGQSSYNEVNAVITECERNIPHAQGAADRDLHNYATKLGVRVYDLEKEARLKADAAAVQTSMELLQKQLDGMAHSISRLGFRASHLEAAVNDHDRALIRMARFSGVDHAKPGGDVAFIGEWNPNLGYSKVATAAPQPDSSSKVADLGHRLDAMSRSVIEKDQRIESQRLAYAVIKRELDAITGGVDGVTADDLAQAKQLLENDLAAAQARALAAERFVTDHAKRIKELEVSCLEQRNAKLLLESQLGAKRHELEAAHDKMANLTAKVHKLEGRIEGLQMAANAKPS